MSKSSCFSSSCCVVVLVLVRFFSSRHSPPGCGSTATNLTTYVENCYFHHWTLVDAGLHLDFHHANLSIFSREHVDDPPKWPLVPFQLVVHNHHDVINLDGLRCVKPLRSSGQGWSVFVDPASPEVVGQLLSISPPLTCTVVGVC